jgi:hypothetical protein
MSHAVEYVGPSQRATLSSLDAIVRIRLDLERQWSAGPWDNWDGVLLDQMRTAASRRYDECLHDLCGRLDDLIVTDYVIVERVS